MNLSKVRATVRRMERLVKRYQHLQAVRRGVTRDIKRTEAELDRLIITKQYRSRVRRHERKAND